MSRLIGILVALAASCWFSVSSAGPLPTERRSLEPGWYARIQTSNGEIVARLLADQAPNSVASFAALAQGRREWTDSETGEIRKEPYYDGLLISQIAAGRMILVGDRSAIGEGTPTIYVPFEGSAPVTFSGGQRLGMMRLGGRNSGVIFFVTASALPEFDGLAPCFGEVTSGQEVVFQISQAKAHPDGTPIDPIVIERIQIYPVGDPPPLPEPDSYVPHPVTPSIKKATKP